MEVVPLRGRYAILAERKDNLFTDVVCGRGDCAGMTYVITSSGLICQFDENRQMQIERDLQVSDRNKLMNKEIHEEFFLLGKNKLSSYWRSLSRCWLYQRFRLHIHPTISRFRHVDSITSFIGCRYCFDHVDRVSKIHFCFIRFMRNF